MVQPETKSTAQKLVEAREMVQRKQEVIVKLNQRIADQAEIIARRDEAIVKLNQRIVDQAEIVARRDEAIVRRDEAIGKLNNRLASRDEREGRDAEFQTLAHNSAEGMNAFFQQVDDREIYTQFGLAVRALMDSKAVPLDGVELLDFGTGPGLALKALIGEARPKRVVGYDFSENALQIAAAEIPGGQFGVADIYQPTAEQFDLVLCMEVLEHLEYPERALATLVGAVRPGGTLLLTVPQGRLDRSRYHVNFWSPESWLRFLEREIGTAGEVEAGTFAKMDETVHRNNFAILRKTPA
ncbi:class I SAM-dependent methyltransferase [Paracoccus zhejiangensis]|uniref:Class I SAM-dependent methyltransferase n=1 Tax=Paracoccus zhejiangensis TaxID=1077935 RepID=A0A2H5F654_9RHOB|nr:class I SAM-dependent methyltransferase [Paracoccus zhejiangensis]AUH67041.1 hypothetical protein CX676_22385 [Paracoccus zhejiangensis]